MASYKTPGVYVEEIPKLPQSVADVPTAIPGFVGYTEFASSKSDKEDNGLRNKAVKINSLMEYERFFGKGPKLSVDDKGGVIHKFVTYDSIRLFYNNGGGVCYIVSIGDYDYETTTHKPEDFNNGLKQLEDIDEITLLVMPDATTCLASDTLASVQQQALLQCKTLKDRFAILDVKEDETVDKSIENFRSNIGNAGLEYGAAYYPYVATTFSYELKFSDVVKYIITETYKNKEEELLAKLDAQSVITLCRTLNIKQTEASKYLTNFSNEELKKAYNPQAVDVGKIWKNSSAYGISLTDAEKAIKDVEEQKKIIINKIDAKINNKNSDYLKKHLLDINPTDPDQEIKEQALKSFIPYYKELEEELVQKASVIPPSGAIAGIYAQNDNFVGVWKAPANMSIASVKGVSCLINNSTQEGMNVHSSGKSINAIRFFSGKGILIWGARTLKGNDNEWRYIPVRRLFNYVEESVQESTEWAVFSPNNQNTWTKIKSQIENFLTNIWRAGGLAGATSAEAFYVNVGLNSTMDAQDILEGRLIVEIGMAAVRPAEFIILRFSHKLQES